MLNFGQGLLAKLSLEASICLDRAFIAA